MFARRRCSFCRRWFYPHPRLKQRQKTCGQPDCRRKQKQKSSRQWRSKYPDYFRGSYEHQKEIFGTRFLGLKFFIHIPTCALTPSICGKNRMQETCPCGSVRGALGNWRPYRDSKF
jgi:hypothetical protein